MKVLFVEAYPGFRGAQRSLAALIAGLPAEVEATVVCALPGRAAAGYAAVGARVLLLPVPPPLAVPGGAASSLTGRVDAGLRGLLPYTWRLLRLLRREGPDLVHCNETRALFLAAPAARLLGLPVIWHLRGLSTLGRAGERSAGMLASRILCVSEAVKRSLSAAARERAAVVYNGADPDPPSTSAVAAVQDELTEVRRRQGLSAAGATLITASSFVPYKGLHHLAGALGSLFADRPELRREVLWVALGDDEGVEARTRYRAQLAGDLARIDAAANVWWGGWRDDARPWLAAADVVVLPTVARETFCFADGETVEAVCSEGFPRTVLEAMTAGTAVVASDVAGVREQLADGVSGVVVPPGDVRALAAALARLIDRPEERRRLAAAARQRAEAFSVEVMVRRTLAEYRRLALAGGAP